jgi:hypothetical protein
MHKRWALKIALGVRSNNFLHHERHFAKKSAKMFVELRLENRLSMIYTRLVYFVKDAFIQY